MNTTTLIYFSLLLTVSVNGLQCFHCNPHKENPCSEYPLSALHIATCREDQVCFKALMYPAIEISNNPSQGRGPDFETGHFTVHRGCLERNLSSEINSFCEFKEYKPDEGFLCFCSDKDFCNGAETLRKSFFISRFDLVIIALNVYLSSSFLVC